MAHMERPGLKAYILLLVVFFSALECLAGDESSSPAGYKKILTRDEVEADPTMARKMKLFEERLISDPPTQILVDGEVVMCVKVSNQLSLMGESEPMFFLLKPPADSPLEADEPVRSSGNDDLIEMATTRYQEYEGKQICPSGTFPYKHSAPAEAADAAAAADGEADAWNAEPAVAVGTSSAVHEYAHGYMNIDNRGMRVVVNLQQPKVEKRNEFSLAQLWLVSYEGKTNTIEVGWQVYEQLYGDNKTRLFVYWTADGYNKTGCYNLACPGFVQTSSTIVVGAPLSPISQNGGPQYTITLLVFKDIPSDRWWLKIGNEYVGYWPATLFSNSLRNRSVKIDCGGEIIDDKSTSHTSTHMGSGQFPAAGYGRAAFMRNIEYVDFANTLHSATSISLSMTLPKCYGAAANPDAAWGGNFFFGGPGRSANCS